MKILILGAGQVGASVAATLAREDDDITPGRYRCQ